MTGDVWTYLASCEKPIILYGMGNGADKILSVFECYGITCSGVFASDGFVRGQAFHGMTVESYAAVSRRLDDFIVVVSFASRLPDVIENVMRIAAERELYIPDVPVVFDGDLFNREFYENHRADLENVRALFADDESKAVFDDIIEYRLSARPDPLFRHTADRADVVKNILSFEKYASCVDAGAYVGDTLAELCSYTAPEFILALEPDVKNFRKLSAFCENRPGFHAVNSGAWDKDEVLTFNTGAGRGSVISAKGKGEVQMTSIDIALGGRSVDYIKYDVEGAEYKALLGSRGTICNFSPDLCVSLYHRSEDIFVLPLLVREMNPAYRFYLRRYRCMPAWEIDLYAIT